MTSDWITDEKNDLSLSEASQQAAVASSRAGHEQILEFLLDMPEVLSMFIQPIFCYSQLVLVCQIEYVLIQNISRSL